ncbi:Epoxide hydrolase srdG [Paramyrothecium foliicola]|nr:Epoxide hydrolase srdG [Paramyrothecium foliicola]
MSSVNEPLMADEVQEASKSLNGDVGVGDENAKRKAPSDGENSASKRTRQDDEDNSNKDRTEPTEPTNGPASGLERRRSEDEAARGNDERRKSAVQEEKKRSKRLFGGLLSTLSQTTANPHQKRRQEIERRQQERLQQQKAEDDQKRVDKSTRLRDVRMAQQIVWDEEVMRNKHSKMLDLARYLQTKARPHIYYLPWKLTEEQQDLIDDQIRQANKIVDRELDDFERRKDRHVERYGTRRRSSVAARPLADLADPVAPIIPDDERDTQQVTEDRPQEADQSKSGVAMTQEHHHHHDDSGDVMVEADPCTPICPEKYQKHIAMDTSKLVPNDPRVRTESATVRGRKYTYIIGEPQGEPIDTVILCHGWPDLAFGWRYQIPVLMANGYRVVAPNMLGYAGTDRPDSLEEFSFKTISGDINELAKKFVGDGQIILGGHDWGGALVWRTAMWFPKLIKAVFSVCTPFHPPQPEWHSLQDIIASGRLRQFGYQLHLAGPELEQQLQGPEKLRQLLNGLFGGIGPDGEFGISMEKGVLLDNLPKLRPTRLLSSEELDFYVQEYMRQEAPQMRGPFNWYRTRKVNWEEELPLTKESKQLEMPALFIMATRDAALPPAMSAGMEKYFKQLTREEVNSSHWALWQTPDAVNEQLVNFLNKVHGASKSNL